MIIRIPPDAQVKFKAPCDVLVEAYQSNKCNFKHKVNPSDNYETTLTLVTDREKTSVKYIDGYTYVSDDSKQLAFEKNPNPYSLAETLHQSGKSLKNDWMWMLSSSAPKISSDYTTVTVQVFHRAAQSKRSSQRNSDDEKSSPQESRSGNSSIRTSSESCKNSNKAAPTIEKLRQAAAEFALETGIEMQDHGRGITTAEPAYETPDQVLDTEAQESFNFVNIEVNGHIARLRIPADTILSGEDEINGVPYFYLSKKKSAHPQDDEKYLAPSTLAPPKPATRPSEEALNIAQEGATYESMQDITPKDDTSNPKSNAFKSELSRALSRKPKKQ